MVWLFYPKEEAFLYIANIGLISAFLKADISLGYKCNEVMECNIQ